VQIFFLILQFAGEVAKLLQLSGDKCAGIEHIPRFIRHRIRSKNKIIFFM